MKTWLLAVLVTLLVTDAPLTCVYSLKAQLRYLTQLLDDGGSAQVSEAYRTDTLPHSVAFNLEPKAVLQQGTRQTTVKSATTFFAPPRQAAASAPKWAVVQTVLPHDSPATSRPLLRVYDPLGPPSVHL